jgi:hypothetical protein
MTSLTHLSNGPFTHTSVQVCLTFIRACPSLMGTEVHGT